MSTHTGQLPPLIRTALDRMATGMARALPKDLVAVVLYGSAVRGDWDAAHSDANVLVVLKEVTTQTCDALMPALQDAQRDVLVRMDLTTEHELVRSADVFPLLILDIQRAHKVLHGINPLQGVEVAWHHLRLRVEQQTKRALFTLRTQYITFYNRPERLEEIIRGSVGPLISSMGALVYLRDPSWWISGKQHIVEAAVEQLDVDEPLIQTLLRVSRHQTRMSGPEVRQLFDHLLALHEHIALLVDEQLQHDSDPLEDMPQEQS